MVACFSIFSGSASAQAVITTDPVDVTGCAGTTKIFHIAATSATTYRWQVSTDGTTWDSVNASTFYSTVTDDTLTVMLDPSLNNKMYRSIAFATAGNDTSAAATLHVETASAGTLTGPDAVCIGGNVAFTSTVPGGVWSNVNSTLDTITAAGIDTGRAAGTDTVKYTVTNSCGATTAWRLIRVDAPASALPITGPNAVCVGSNITLANANVVGTHTWSSANVAIATVSSTGVVHGVASGINNITYTFTNGCGTVVSIKSVMTDTIISAGTITGPNTVCNGSWIHLTQSATGGIWLSAPTSVAVVDASGNVTGVGGGVAVISYYFSNSCGASFAAHTVTVAVAVGAISGNDSVGIDSTLMLTNPTPGGTWTSSNDVIATVGSTGIVTGHDTGVVTITYSVTNACGSSSATTTVNVGPAPFGGVIAGPDSVCAGSTATYVDTTSHGVITGWRSKWDSVATISPAGLFTPASFSDTDSHLYRVDTIYATVTSAFGTTIIKRPVTVARLTLTAPSTVSLGGSYNLVGTPSGGTFTSSNPSVAPLVGYGFFVVIAEGTSVFSYSTALCGSAVARDTIKLGGSSGLNSAEGISESLSVFPNPSNGSVNVNLAYGIHEDVTITVTNVIGETIKQVATKSNVNTEITLNDQPSGVYLLTATTASGKKYSTKVNISK